MKRTLRAIAGAAVLCALAWVAGFDFDKRGHDALLVATLALAAAWFGAWT